MATDLATEHLREATEVDTETTVQDRRSENISRATGAMIDMLLQHGTSSRILEDFRKPIIEQSDRIGRSPASEY